MIGPTLRHYRERAGLSQRALAERAGVGYTTIGRIERPGTSAARPGLGVMLAIIAALDDPEAETALLAASGYDRRADPLTDDVLRDVERHLATVSAERKRALLRAFETLTRIA